jgi:hypothetical protein
LYKLLKQMQGEENKNGFSEHFRWSADICRRAAARAAIFTNFVPIFAAKQNSPPGFAGGTVVAADELILVGHQ